MRSDKIVASVSDPLAAGGQLSPDGRIGVATLTYKGEFQEFKAKDFKRVQVAAFSARGPALQVEHGGQGAEFVRFTEQGGGTEFISLIAAALILMLMFGSLIAAGVPLLSAMLALGTTIGLVPVISQIVDTPDFASQLAALMGIGVGIDYALIVVTRYRAEHGSGLSRDDAILRAQDTAGRTVFFAAFTVIIALLGLLLLGLSFLHGAAIAAALAVLLTMIAALTVLPAILSKSGDWIDRLRLPLPGRERRAEAAAAAGERLLGTLVGVRPAPPVAGGRASRRSMLLALASPALHMRLGTSDAGLDPEGTTTRIAYDTIAEGFGAGVNGSFLLAVKLEQPGDDGAASQVAAAVRPIRTSRSSWRRSCRPTRRSRRSSRSRRPGHARSRRRGCSSACGRSCCRGSRVRRARRCTSVGRRPRRRTSPTSSPSKLPLFVGSVVLLSALLLLAVFRSLFIPIKAALMNLLSIGAALGFVTLVFQDGCSPRRSAAAPARSSHSCP